MSIRVVLGLIDGGPAAEAAARAALAAAERFGAHLQLLHVRPDPGKPGADDRRRDVRRDGRPDGRRLSGRERRARAAGPPDRRCARRRTPRRVGEGGVTLAFREEEGREDEVAARLGRLHDLIVLARAERQTGAPASVTLESVLLHSGRPVLVAPAEPVRGIGRKVVVAWNGKAQSARALGASLPYLAKAESVTVLTAVETHTAGRPSEVVRYLSWHAIRAEAAEVTASGPGKVGQVLLEKVGELGADLLVMGAYGHSRLREMILGGATREVLGHAVLPVLMAH